MKIRLLLLLFLLDAFFSESPKKHSGRLIGRKLKKKKSLNSRRKRDLADIKGELIKLGTQHRHIIHALEVIGRQGSNPPGSGEPDDGSGVGTGESGGSGDSGKGFKLFLGNHCKGSRQ